jgi:hypothetical protein
MARTEGSLGQVSASSMCATTNGRGNRMPLKLNVEITSPMTADDHELLSGVSVMLLAIANHELAKEKFPEAFGGDEATDARAGRARTLRYAEPRRVHLHARGRPPWPPHVPPCAFLGVRPVAGELGRCLRRWARPRRYSLPASEGLQGAMADRAAPGRPLVHDGSRPVHVGSQRGCGGLLGRRPKRPPPLPRRHRATRRAGSGDRAPQRSTRAPRR